ncbi:MAG: site-specific integrase, partial [Ktedonobacteraceae bacterium]
MRTIKMAHEQDNDFNSEASVREAVQSFLFSIKHLSQHTQRSYIKKLADFQEWCEENNYNLSTLKPKQITLFTEYVTNRNNQRNGNTLSDETVKSYIRAVKTFLKWCSRDEDFEDYVTERTVSRIALPRVDKKLKRIYSNEEITKLLDATKKEVCVPL